MSATAPCLSITPDATMLERARKDAATGRFIFVKFDQLTDRVTEADGEQIDNLDRIDSAFFATHAMIEKTALLQKDRTTYRCDTNTHSATNSEFMPLAESIYWMNVRRHDELRADQTTRICTILAIKASVSPRGPAASAGPARSYSPGPVSSPVAGGVPCILISTDAAMLERVRQDAATGRFIFVKFDDLTARVTEADGVQIENSDQINSAFLLTHAMIEKATLSQPELTTYRVDYNTGAITCAYPNSLQESIGWLNVRRGDIYGSDDTTRIFKIVVLKERLA